MMLAQRACAVIVWVGIFIVDAALPGNEQIENMFLEFRIEMSL